MSQLIKKKDLYLNYIYEFILSFNLTHLIWPTYLIIKGYSLIDVGVCESLFHVVSMLGEMPTGVISDLYGRRLSRLLGRIANIVSIVLLVWGVNIWIIYLSFALTALSYNLESGTDSAYVYDLLVEYNCEQEFARVQGIREVILQVAMLLAIYLGGLISKKSYDLTYMISIGVGILSIIVLLTMKEIKNKKYIKTNIINDMKNQWLTSYSLIKQDHYIILYIMCYALFSASTATIYYYITNYWSELGIGIDQISFYLSFENIAGIIAGVLTYKVMKKFNQKQLLLYIPLCIIIGLLGVPFFPISIMSICFMAFFESMLYVSMSTFLNERVDSSCRATLLSTMSMGYSLVMIIYFPIIGTIGHFLNLKIAFYVLIIMNIIVYTFYRKAILKEKLEDNVL